MAQAGFTPIQLYHSTTPAAAPTAGNLIAGELAINTADGILYYEDSAGVVKPIAQNITPVANGGTGVTTSTGTVAVVLSTAPTIIGPTINDGYTEEVFAIPSSTTPALSPTNGSIQTWTLTGASTPTAGTWASGQSMTLMVDDGSAYTINWASVAVTWKTDSGVAPTLNTTGFTAIALWKVDTVVYGARVGNA
jgi:hypothetical protein